MSKCIWRCATLLTCNCKGAQGYAERFEACDCQLDSNLCVLLPCEGKEKDLYIYMYIYITRSKKKRRGGGEICSAFCGCGIGICIV